MAFEIFSGSIGSNMFQIPKVAKFHGWETKHQIYQFSNGTYSSVQQPGQILGPDILVSSETSLRNPLKTWGLAQGRQRSFLEFSGSRWLENSVLGMALLLGERRSRNSFTPFFWTTERKLWLCMWQYQNMYILYVYIYSIHIHMHIDINCVDRYID